MSKSKVYELVTKDMDGNDVDMSDCQAVFKANMEAIEVREHAEDSIDDYTNEELACMVREGIFTIEQVEAALRRRMAHEAS